MNHLRLARRLRRGTFAEQVLAFWHGAGQRRAQSYRPLLEALEDRTTPAVVPFATPPAISLAANGAYSVATADLDGDGDLDVLSASVADNKIAWYENDGAAFPSFTLRTISTTASQAQSVTAADLDGDGDTDVLSASFGDDKIAWYENDGAADPSFTLRTISTAADGARSVSVADLDGDGDLDVLSASQVDNKIAWYENDGAAVPSFTLNTISTDATTAFSVTTADLDGDGDIDVLSASSSDKKIAWYENDGAADPTFTLRTISTTAFGANSVATADLDGDGDLDVLSASYNDDKIAWYENDGAADPTFTLRTISITADRAHSVTAADLDGDGDTDVLSASIGDNKIAWYENDGAAVPTFTLRTISTSASQARSVSPADVDGDGDLDVLSASTVDDKIAWYENDGAAVPAFTLHTISTTASDARSVSVADLDGDGDTDVLSASSNDNKIAWYENDGAAVPAFTLHTISTTASSAESVSAADLDGDGDTDVLSASQSDDKIAWYENDGAAVPAFTLHTISTTADSAFSVAAADVDGDGDLDVLSAAVNDDTIAWYPNRTQVLAATGSDTGLGDVHFLDGITGAELAVFTAYDTAGYNGGARVALADVTGDGIPDVITATGKGMTDGALVKVFNGADLLDGTVTLLLSFHPYGTGYSKEVFVAAGDFNNDNRADIVTGNVATGPTVKVFDGADLLSSNPVLEPHSLKPFGATYVGGARVAVGDVNGDGTQDVIAGQSKNGSKVRAISGVDFLTVLVKKTVSTTVIAGGVFVAAGPIDADNRVDIIVGLGSGAKSKVFAFEDASNLDTTATLLVKSAPIYATTYTGGVRVAATDLDGDGDAEVLTTAGAGLSPYRLRVLGGLTLAQLDAFFSQAPDFTEPRFVAAARLGAL